jgi:signal transduction histidine kinase
MTRRTSSALARGVVGRTGERGLVRAAGPSRDLVRKEEAPLVSGDDERCADDRYLGAMAASAAIAGRAGAPPARDVALAAVLAAAGVLEVLAGAGGDGSRAVSAAAVVAATAPLAWRRSIPLLPPVAVVVALIAQVPLDGFLVGDTATPVIALVIALYSAGRYVDAGPGLAAAAVVAVVATGIRVAADPAADSVGHAVLTLVAMSLPLIVGRWVRGQDLLRRRFAERAERLARDRERDAREAAEEERMRIAGDLQAAIAGRLQEIVRRADALPESLRADRAGARASLATIATTARDALADVRRVLGILRREGQAPRLTPHAAAPLVVVEAGAPPAEAGGRETAPGHDPGAPEGDTGVDGDADSAHDRRASSDARPASDADSAHDRAPGTPFADSVLDRLLVAALIAGAEVDLAFTVPAGDRLVAALTAIPIALPLLWRRSRPLLVGAVVLAAVALQSLLLDLDGFPVSDIAAVVCVTYAIGAHADRRHSVAGLFGAVTGAAVHAAIFYPDGVVAALLGGVAAPWTVGRVIRGHRELTRQGRDEAARAERARAREARAAVVAERMRVARELHDAVAHNISVIAIQAGGADGIVDRDPERTAQIAALIATVAREAVAELGRLAGPLATSSDGTSGDTAAPPSLAHVEALAARARDAGQPVELRVEGDPAALPGGVDLAAYRIVQEALTNASKHAAGARAEVVVRYERTAVEVEIADDGRGDAAPIAAGTGHGLIGIRERVALYGGTLDAGRRPSGGFRVHARFPIGGT